MWCSGARPTAPPSPMSWEVQLDHGWVQYDATSAAQLQHAFSMGTAEFEMHVRGTAYIFRLDPTHGCTQTNKKTRMTRAIRQSGAAAAMPAPWAYQDGSRAHPVWTPYGAAEQACLNAAQSAGQATVQLNVGPGYIVDLQQMLQTNMKSGYQRSVRHTGGTPATTPAAGATTVPRWQCLVEGTWMPYPPDLQQVLEQAHSTGQASVDFLSRGGSYRASFTTGKGGTLVGEQINIATGFRRDISRGAPPMGGPHMPAHMAMAPPAGFMGAVLSAGFGAGHAPGSGAERISFKACDSSTLDYAAITKWQILTPGTDYDPNTDCTITCDPLGTDVEVVRLPCKSTCIYRRDVLEQCFTSSGPKCPLCGHHYEMPGPQPTGELTVSTTLRDCDGHTGQGSIQLHYTFGGGVQGRQHPKPGQRYSGTERVAYLPNSEQGKKAAELLKKVFLAGKMFIIGTSVTSGKEDTVVYGGVHIKTKTSGGATNHGWPDPTYFERLMSECYAQGIGTLPPDDVDPDL